MITKEGSLKRFACKSHKYGIMLSKSRLPSASQLLKWKKFKLTKTELMKKMKKSKPAKKITSKSKSK